MVVDLLAERHGVRWNATSGVGMAVMGEGVIAGQHVMLAKPMTFMNRSGLAVRELIGRCGLPPSRLIVVLDDLDLPWGYVRVRPRGSSGGHRGLESVIAALGTDQFVRVRLGIHPGRAVRDAAEFVLAPLPPAFEQDLEEVLGRGAAAVECILAEGVEQAMAKFNRRAQGFRREEQ